MVVQSVGMLDNPENKVWLDVDTIVATRNRQAAIRRCRELAEYNELRGEGRLYFLRCHSQ